MSLMIYETEGVLFQNANESLFLFVSQGSWLVSVKPVETATVPVSQTFSPSHPFDLHLERCSPQWSSSTKMKLSLFTLRSPASKTSVAFFSNPLLTMHSDVPSILFGTVEFMALISETFLQLKVSLESVKIASGAAGGALIAFITIFCSSFLLHRRHIDECDFPTERSEEEEFDTEDERIFDLEDERAQTNSNALSESECVGSELFDLEEDELDSMSMSISGRE
jgi:hypothetical protein